MLEVDAWSASILRFGSACGAFWLWDLVNHIKSRASPLPGKVLTHRQNIKQLTRRDWLALLALAIMSFFVTPLSHMWGLFHSKAVVGSLVVAIEPLLAVFLAWLILGESLSRRDAVAFALALLGFLFLAEIPAELVKASDSSKPWSWTFFWGASLLLLGVFGEAIGSVGAKILTGILSPDRVFGYALTVGALGLFIVSVVMSPQGAFSLPQDIKGWSAVLWIGPLGTAITYIFWMKTLQSGVPVSHVVLTLLIQPLLGALAGWVWLGETLGVLQLLGGSMILVGVWLQK